MSRRRVAVATGNPGKVREFRAILGDAPLELVGLDELAPVAFPEEGDEYGANARAKALAAARDTGLPALADDSGIEAEALDGAPGPLSARYGGPHLDDAGRCAELLAAVARAGAGRGARFVCHAAFALPDGRCETAEGVCCGVLAEAPRGSGGFGYDPIFLPAGGSCSMGELPPHEKHRISHRGRALRALLPRMLALLEAEA